MDATPFIAMNRFGLGRRQGEPLEHLLFAHSTPIPEGPGGQPGAGREAKRAAV